MNTRHGHSLVEMLVVLIIVGVLIAVVVPAVQRAREAARMVDCTNRQAELAKAVHMHINDEPYGRFPGYRAFGPDGTTVVGWAPQLFEYMGRDKVPAIVSDPRYIELLTCPSDQGPKDGPRLNYVVNGGQAGIDSPADGIFYDHAQDERVYITKDDFRDGLTNTILLAENLDATNWNNTDEESQCILWPLTTGNEINNGSGSRPSSHHPDGFVTAFADGSVKFMSEVQFNDDPNVHATDSIYVAYLTPGGEDSEPLAYTGPGPDPCYPPDEGPQVDKGLNWISRHMFVEPDGTGYWSVVHSTHPDCQGQCDEDAPTPNAHNAYSAATAIALLPMLGSGNTTASGPYRNEVCRGISYLMKQQDPNTGQIVDAWPRPDLTHSIAYLALAEALILSEHANSECPSGIEVGGCSVDMYELRTAVEKATAHMIARQKPDGGWNYAHIGDVSHHGWAVGAFMAAERAGVTVDPTAVQKARDFLTNSLVPPGYHVTSNGVTLGSQYRYRADYGPTARNTAMGLMCEVLLGAPRDHPAITSFIAGQVPSSPAGGQTYAVYTNQAMSILMNAVGDPHKTQWNTAMRDLLVPAQLTSSAGHAEGSWSDQNPLVESTDTHWGGRHYVTCMYLLSLQSYYAELRLGDNTD